MNKYILSILLTLVCFIVYFNSQELFNKLRPTEEYFIDNVSGRYANLHYKDFSENEIDLFETNNITAEYKVEYAIKPNVESRYLEFAVFMKDTLIGRRSVSKLIKSIYSNEQIVSKNKLLKFEKYFGIEAQTLKERKLHTFEINTSSKNKFVVSLPRESSHKLVRENPNVKFNTDKFVQLYTAKYSTQEKELETNQQYSFAYGFFRFDNSKNYDLASLLHDDGFLDQISTFGYLDKHSPYYYTLEDFIVK